MLIVEHTANAVARAERVNVRMATVGLRVKTIRVLELSAENMEVAKLSTAMGSVLVQVVSLGMRVSTILAITSTAENTVIAHVWSNRRK
jgi:hypothetical protein